MKYLCTMDADLRQCQLLDQTRKYCAGENVKCSFCEVEQKNNPQNPKGYVRQERWYEKYYRK